MRTVSARLESTRGARFVMLLPMKFDNRTFLGALLLIGVAGCSGKTPGEVASGGTVSGSAGGGAGIGAGVGGLGAGGHGTAGGLGDPSSVSNLPSPSKADVPRPSARGLSGFRVLSWAGFRGAVSYSFDDTQPSLFEHWPALKGTLARMTFYANPTSNWIAGYDATLTEAVTLGHELGNHTMSHCRADLSGCAGVPPLTPVGTAAEEVDRCSEYLVELGQSAVWSIAYPYGDLAWKSVAAERFLLGRGVAPGHVAALGAADPLALPAVAAVAGDTVAKFDAEIDQARAAGDWVIFLFHSLLPTTNNWYAGVDVTTVTESVANAHRAGDVWVDSVVRVGAYWLAEKAVRSGATVPEGVQEKRTWTLPEHFPPGQYLRVVVDGGSLTQNGGEVPWDPHGYYEISLDAGEVTWSPE